MANDHQDVLQDVEELEQRFQTDQSSEVFLPLVQAYLRRGLPLQAIEACQKALKSSDSLDGHMFLAQAFFDASAIKRSYLKNADSEVDYVLGQDKDSWNAHRLKGEIALENDDLQAAISSLKVAHQLNPDHPQAQMLLKSLGVDVEKTKASDGEAFYIDVDTSFIRPDSDSLFKTFRDVTIFFIVILMGVYFYAENSVLEKKIRALVTLGRTQQRMDTYTGLKKSVLIYQKILKQFDAKHPFALMHLSEVYYDLWKYHERKDVNYQKYRQYFGLTQNLSLNILNRLARWHALRGLVGYDQGQKQLRSGKIADANTTFSQTQNYLKNWVVKIPVSARVNWVQGLIFEALQKKRHAAAYLKRAAELGWNTPKYRWRQGMNYMRFRDYAGAHNKFKQATEQGQQNKSFVSSTLSDPTRQKNDYCWIDPPILLGRHSKPGLQLGIADLLMDAFNSALLAESLPQCSFHPSFQKYYAATKYYLPANLMDALSVLDSGVGMSAAFSMVKETKKIAEKVKKHGDLSPHWTAWLAFLEAKMYWYRNDYKKSLTFIDKALKIVDYEPLFQNLKGMLQVKNKQYDAAWISFEKAFKLDPQLLQLYYEAADQFLKVVDADGKHTQLDKVEKVLAVLKKHYPKHADYSYLYGRLEVAQGHQKAAIERWTKTLEDKHHYEISVELGKVWLKKARSILALKKAKRINKDVYPDLVKQFKKHKADLMKKVKSRLQTQDMKKHAIDYKKQETLLDQFVLALDSNKRIKSKEMQLYLANLMEIYYEEAGNYLQQAMKTRPGAVDARIWTGLIYLDNESYNDATGHFNVAAAGFIRDLDFVGAKKAYGYLLQAQAGDRKKDRKWPAKVAEFFKGKIVFVQLRQGAAKVKAKKVQLMAKNKEEEAKKYKAPPEDINKVFKTIKAVAEVFAQEKKLKKDAEMLFAEADFLKKHGFLAAVKHFQQSMRDSLGKKGKRRRRRRRRRRR